MLPNHRHILVGGAIGIVLLILLSRVADYVSGNGAQTLYKLSSAQPRSITQIVKATGFLEVRDSMKIGSLVSGIIKQMFVEENELVSKGQILAEIDDGKEDAEVCQTRALVEKAQAMATYYKSFFKRQKELHNSGYVSDDEFEKALRDYREAKAAVSVAKGAHQKAELEFNNKQIRAPDDGLVIGKIAREGETVTLSAPATIIYTIAKNIAVMDAKLEVDESAVGYVKKGMDVELVFETYPHQVFAGKITEVSRAPVKQNRTVSYRVTVPVDNADKRFAPDMTFDAYVTIAHKDDVLSVPGHVFKMNRSALSNIAQAMGYTMVQLEPSELSQLKKEGNYKTVWVSEGYQFVERPVKIGVNDYAFFEVVEGLSASDQIVFDLAEPDVMKKFFERFFGKGL